MTGLLSSGLVVPPVQPAVLVDNLRYDAAGRLARLRYAAVNSSNGITLTHYYNNWTGNDGNANGRYWGMNVSTVAESADVMAARYAYDTYANMTYQAFTWQNKYSDANTVFAYDDQNRVTAAYGQGFGWQPWGSLTSVGGDTYGYAAGRPHAVELVNGVDRYDYDANGNMVVRSKGVSGQEQALQWDANNRLAQVVSSSGVTETYRYDEHGQRIRKQVAYSSTVGDTVTYVPFVFYEQAVSAGGSVVTRHYSVNGERVAVRVGGALSYLYRDQVGSTILATDAITNVVSSRGYYAFGATRRSSGVTPTDRRFTGQVEDPTGLYYYNSRYYDPQLGQFLSPDTIVPEPTNLLSYNRYLYAKGNPLKYSDPTGHYSVEELQQHFGVNSFDELMALFGEGGQYEGNSGWYDILRAAQDGDQITAVLPDAVTSISGNFTRDADGRIQIDMGGGQIVAENVFAEFGGHRTGMTYNGHPAEYGAYYLQGASGARWATAVSGTQAIADVPCNTWDCVAIGYDIAAIGGNALYSVSLAGVLPSGGLSTAGVYSGILISHAASAAGLYRTYKGLATGSTSTVDLAIANVTTWVSPMPGLGAHMQGIQLAWDLIDPFVPD